VRPVAVAPFGETGTHKPALNLKGNALSSRAPSAIVNLFYEVIIAFIINMYNSKAAGKAESAAGDLCPPRPAQRVLRE
jgi:hypothetical protein